MTAHTHALALRALTVSPLFSKAESSKSGSVISALCNIELCTECQVLTVLISVFLSLIVINGHGVGVNINLFSEPVLE
jgi:hypothetical protein